MTRARTNADNVTADISGITAGTGISGGGTSGTVTVSLDTTSAYVVPSQTSASGKYLTSDGTNASWAVLDTDSIIIADIMDIY